jgi:uncharacterized protein (TIGR02996 family)
MPAGPDIHSLFQRLLEHPEDDELYLVCADCLQQLEDPRGELILVQHLLEQTWSVDLFRAQQALVERRQELLPAELFGNRALRAVAEWRLGFVRTLRVRDYTVPGVEPPDIVSAVARALEHPSMALLERLCFGSVAPGNFGHEDFGPLLELLLSRKPRFLRSLSLGDFHFGRETRDGDEWGHLASAGAHGVNPWRLLRNWPGLEELSVETVRVTAGTLATPGPRWLRIATRRGCCADALDAISSTTWPALERLELFGIRWATPDDALSSRHLEPLFSGEVTPALTHLGLGLVLSASQCEALVASPLLRQLKTLDLAHTELRQGARGALEDSAALAKLERLILPRR